MSILKEFGYEPPIPKTLEKQYESALRGVVRWRNGKWADNLYETDMDHVAGMFIVLSDIQGVCPTLKSDLDISTVQHMIYIHDGGEIHPKTGDLAHGVENYDLIHDGWKRREHAAFRLYTRLIENPNVKHEARELYIRCAVAKAENDKEALFTDFIDKLQGSRFGFKNVFNEKHMKQASRQIQFNHTSELLTTPLKPLLKLVTPSTKIGLTDFLKKELIKFSTFGYQKEAKPYIENLDAILVKP